MDNQKTSVMSIQRGILMHRVSALLAAVLFFAAGCTDNMLQPSQADEGATDGLSEAEVELTADFDSEEAAAKYKWDWRHRGESVYEVTVQNLTGGQPFSPPIFATHKRPVRLFKIGRRANKGIQEIAENGNNEPLRNRLNWSRLIADVAEGDAPLVPEANPGGTPFSSAATYEISASRGANYVSGAWMLICTNDGFSGLDGVRLPRRVGDSVTRRTGGYDAGTEMNTEDFANIVPPCQGLIGVSSDDPGIGMSEPAIAERKRIRKHRGIAGGNDLLPEVHGWEDPVATVTITRIK
jgi:hypothetical protein